MRTVNVHEAKTHFSRLLDEVATGEEVIIAKAGKPFAKLTAIQQSARIPGAAKGKGQITEAFFEPLSEEELKRWQ